MLFAATCVFQKDVTLPEASCCSWQRFLSYHQSTCMRPHERWRPRGPAPSPLFANVGDIPRDTTSYSSGPDQVQARFQGCKNTRWAKACKRSPPVRAAVIRSAADPLHRRWTGSQEPGYYKLFLPVACAVEELRPLASHGMSVFDRLRGAREFTLSPRSSGPATGNTLYCSFCFKSGVGPVHRSID